MQYRSFGSTGLKIAPLGFGMMRLPKKDGAVDVEASIANLRWAIDQGLNYVDTAYNYLDGESERVTGLALQDGYREKVFLATKCPVWKIEKPEDFDALLDEQLARLQTDHVDFYLLHALDAERWQESVLAHGVPERLLTAKQSGKVRYIGFSFHDELPVFKEIVDYWQEWDFCQIQLNYVDTQHQAGLEGLEYAASKGLGVTIMEPLRGGYLTNLPEEAEQWMRKSGKTPIEMALDFLWDRPEVSVTLSGMGSMEQVRENWSYAQRASIGMLQEEEHEAIAHAADCLHRDAGVPCTGCNYCAVCPSGIPISEIFAAYNTCRTKMSIPAGHKLYQALEEKGSVADACVGCGTCESLCPQHIQIRQWLPKVHSLLG